MIISNDNVDEADSCRPASARRDPPQLIAETVWFSSAPLITETTARVNTFVSASPRSSHENPESSMPTVSRNKTISVGAGVGCELGSGVGLGVGAGVGEEDSYGTITSSTSFPSEYEYDEYENLYEKIPSSHSFPYEKSSFP